MSAISLEQAQSQLDAWLAASLAVAQGQSYSIGGRTLTRVNAREIVTCISWWSSTVKRLQAGDGIKVSWIVPV